MPPTRSAQEVTAMSDFMNLNMAPPSEDLLNEPEANFQQELAMFTNATDFFNYDLGQSETLQIPNFERSTENELKPFDLGE